MAGSGTLTGGIADRVAEELAAWLGGTEHVVTLEPRTALAYERSELVRDESAARVAALAAWADPDGSARILVASLQALFQRTIAPDDIPSEPLRLALRQRADAGMVVLFFVLTAALFPFGIGPEPNILARISPGIIWVTALLASLLSLDRLFLGDAADRAIIEFVERTIEVSVGGDEGDDAGPFYLLPGAFDGLGDLGIDDRWVEDQFRRSRVQAVACDALAHGQVGGRSEACDHEVALLFVFFPKGDAGEVAVVSEPLDAHSAAGSDVDLPVPHDRPSRRPSGGTSRGSA